MKHYDYIFTGSGLSALITVYEMILSEKFSDKTILLLDKDVKQTNDRTWCFWDQSTSKFDCVISKKWQSALFANASFKKKLILQPYSYNLIQGLNFYNLVFDTISNHKNIEFINQKITDFKELENNCIVRTEGETYTCDKVFNSILNLDIVRNQTKYPLLQQHFIGWFIKSKEPVFNKEVATFMDFSVEQQENTRFMYVLPTSENEALIEYTLFSKELLLRNEYEDEIEIYIKKIGITDYEIVDKEQGNIPMSSYEFWKHNTKNIINIGSAGGWTKASTGFTFKNVTKYSKKLIQFLTTESDFKKFHKKDKFWFYDLLFIDVLYKDNALGSKVFSSLFKKGNPVLIFKFLDGETSYFEDLQVMLKCPTIPFAKALFGRIFK